MKLRSLWMVSLAIVAVPGCVNRAAQVQAKKTQEIVTDPKKMVTLGSAETRSVSEILEITGEVTTASDSQVGAKVAGRVMAVYVKDGDSVGAGQLIAEIDGVNQRIQVQQAQAQVQSAQSALASARANAAVGPQRSSAAVAQAQAQLRSARAQLQKTLNGARPEERAQADAALQSAKSNLDTAKKELDRVRKLFAEQVVSQQRLDQAENAYSGAQAQYRQAEASLAMQNNWARPEDITSARESVRQAEEAVRTAQASKKLDILLDQQVQSAQANLQGAQATLALARQGLADLQIRAPFAGQISGKAIQPGTVVGSGTPVARIVGTSGNYFEGEFPATVLSKIRIGSVVDVSVDGYAGAGLIGSIVSLSPSASSVGRLFKARVQIPFRPEIRPGMFARAAVTLRTVPDATVVPTQAIVKRGSKSVVFVVQNDKAKLVEVTPGLTTDGHTQVSGVAPGDKVVVSGQSDLDDGSIVTIEKSKSAEQGK